MSIRCRLGFHKRVVVTVPLPAPETRIMYLPLPGHLFQHPIFWPVMRMPYIATEEVVGHKCARCGITLKREEPACVRLAKSQDAALELSRRQAARAIAQHYRHEAINGSRS